MLRKPHNSLAPFVDRHH